MARIEGIRDAEARFHQKRVFAIAAKQAGEVPAPLRIMAKSSGTMWSVGLFETAFGRAKSVPDALKTLVCLRVASMVGCVF